MPYQKLTQMWTISHMTVSTAVLCDRTNMEPIYFTLQMDFCRLIFNWSNLTLWIKWKCLSVFKSRTEHQSASVTVLTANCN